MKKRIVFYYLSAFDYVGGIEKFNRSFIKALTDLNDNKHCDLNILSAYDSKVDERYGSKTQFKGFSKSRIKSAISAIKYSRTANICILGHINLGIVGILIKILYPKCRLIIICHGIEIWGRLPFLKKLALKKADKILAMSNYTRNHIIYHNHILPEKVEILHNTIDPYFILPGVESKPAGLLTKYNLSGNQPVILTISRLSFTEKAKGYDTVISSMPQILKDHPDAIYLLCGRYDNLEIERLQQHIKATGVEKNVIIAGFLNEEEVADHYRLADVFVLPSKKEGFGIVFLEALICGTRVIGGNQDGTMDALRNGLFGTLVNPNSVNEIATAISAELKMEPSRNASIITNNVLSEFGFKKFKGKVENIITV